jgi:hypothetical protein
MVRPRLELGSHSALKWRWLLRLGLLWWANLLRQANLLVQIAR